MNGRKQRGLCHVHVEDVISVKYSGGSKKERAIFFYSSNKTDKNYRSRASQVFLRKGKSYTLELLVQISFNLKEKERKHLYSPETNV